MQQTPPPEKGGPTSPATTAPIRKKPAKERPHDGRGLIIGSKLGLYTGETVHGHHLGYDTATMQLGTIYISNFRLIFVPEDPQKTHFIIKVPLQCISHFAKSDRREQRRDTKVVLKGPQGYYLFVAIKCKDVRTLVWALNTEVGNNHLEFYNYMVRRTFPASTNPRHVFFAYHFKPTWRDASAWSLYDPKQEFLRQGVLNPCSQWRISEVNNDYSLCSTYPKHIVVPKKITDEQLRKIAEFRSKGRLPILSYKHPFNQASLTRSSQPLVGFVGRSVEDEEMIEAIHGTNPNPCKLYILDARPKMNAVANSAVGAGFEQSKNYKNCEVQFLGIGNIHVMRECLKKLKLACNDVDDLKWSANVDASGWLENIKLVLTCAIFMVELIDKKKASVLCHCSDGWDRTSQLTSLAMLMLDGYYRTLKGFMVLIEKEWLSFGHKFKERSGHGDSNHKNDQQAPIFLQFVDCVWQIHSQFPCSFEFNSNLLIFLMDSLYSCQYGTFLFDNEKEREEARVKEETTSVWSYVLNNPDEFTNVFYRDNTENILIPNVSRARIQLWKEYFLRWSWPAKSHYLRFHQYFPSEETHSLMTSQNAAISRLLSSTTAASTTTPGAAAVGEEGVVDEEDEGGLGDEDEEEVAFDASSVGGSSKRRLTNSEILPRRKETLDKRSVSAAEVARQPFIHISAPATLTTTTPAEKDNEANDAATTKEGGDDDSNKQLEEKDVKAEEERQAKED